MIFPFQVEQKECTSGTELGEDALRRVSFWRTYGAPESEGNAAVDEGSLGATGGLEGRVSQAAAV